MLTQDSIQLALTAGTSTLGAGALVRVGRYALERELGRGSSGVVFAARDLRADRPVALKVMLPGRGAIAERRRERFRKEAGVLAGLRHPCIPQVLDFGEHEGLLYLAASLLDGEPLSAASERGVELPIRVLAVRDAARALDHAHGAGVLHRDVKPENVVLGRGRAWLVDFGLAREIDREGLSTHLTSVGQLAGTPAYLAPEQLDADGFGEVGPWTDVRGLGGTLHAALTGRPPLEASRLPELLVAVLEREPDAPSAADIPERLAALCGRMLVRDPGARPELGLVRRELDAWLASVGVDGTPADAADDPRADSDQAHRAGAGVYARPSVARRPGEGASGSAGRPSRSAWSGALTWAAILGVGAFVLGGPVLLVLALVSGPAFEGESVAGSDASATRESPAASPPDPEGVGANGSRPASPSEAAVAEPVSPPTAEPASPDEGLEPDDPGPTSPPEASPPEVSPEPASVGVVGTGLVDPVIARIERVEAALADLDELSTAGASLDAQLVELERRREARRTPDDAEAVWADAVLVLRRARLYRRLAHRSGGWGHEGARSALLGLAEHDLDAVTRVFRSRRRAFAGPIPGHGVDRVRASFGTWLAEALLIDGLLRWLDRGETKRGTALIAEAGSAGGGGWAARYGRGDHEGAVAVGPWQADIFAIVAHKRALAGDRAGATDLVGRALALDRWCGRALAVHALIGLELDEMRGQARVVEWAARASPEDPFVRIVAGRVLGRLGARDAAIGHLESVDPVDAGTHEPVLIAEMLRADGQTAPPHPNADGWRVVARVERRALRAVAAHAGTLWAVGERGVLLSGAIGARPTPTKLSGEPDLVDVWVAAPDRVHLAAGDAGLLLWDGARSAPVEDVTDPIRAVHGSATGEVWAVGDGGSVWRDGGEGWRRVENHSRDDLLDVVAIGGGRALVAGRAGFVGEASSEGVSAIPPFRLGLGGRIVTSDIRALGGSSLADVLIATSFGVARRSDDGAWRLMFGRPPAVALLDRRPGEIVFGCNAQGMGVSVRRLVGAAWTDAVAPAGSVLGLAEAADGRLLAAGHTIGGDGVLLERIPPGSERR